MRADRLNKVLCICLVVGFFQACDSHSKEQDTSPSDIPETFVTVQARFESETLSMPERIDISSIVANEENPTLWLTGVSNTQGSDVVGIAHRVRTNTPGVEFDEYLGYDTQLMTFISMWEFDPLNSPSINADVSTVAWIEQCLGYVRSLDVNADPILINPFAPDGSCLRPATLSAGGEIALFNNARGVLDADGELQFDGFDAAMFGPVAYSLVGDYVIGLSGLELTSAGIEMGDSMPLYLRTSMSDDGRIIALRMAIVPEDYVSIGEIEFQAGILIVNTDTRTFSLIDSHQERRNFCRVCYFNPATDTQISGDGRFVFFLRPDSNDLLDVSANSFLYRYDLERNEIHRLPIDDIIEEDSLTVGRSGDHIAYVADNRLHVLKLSTGERVELDTAILGCNASDCVFESYRLVRNNPFLFSGDGSTMLVQVVPERVGIDEPQNTEEVMLVNMATDTVTRLAPDISIDRIAIDDSGKLIVFQTDSAGLIPDDDDVDADFFIVRR